MSLRNIQAFLAHQSNDYSDLEATFLKKTGKELVFDSISSVDLSEEPLTLTASVVIPAWNAADTIVATLLAIEKSSFNLRYPQQLQVVIADDGSTDNTFLEIQDSKLDLNITVVRQDNFSQGPAMNAGISAAEGEIVIEVDADTVLNFNSIENLMVRHQFYKNVLLTGFRHYVDPDDERVSIDYLRKNGPDAGFFITNDERIQYFEPGYPSNMCLASNHYKRLGNSNGLWMPDNQKFSDPWLVADMVFGMLFSAPREYFNKVGGFDDRFEGWGCDDGYVGAKLVSEGLKVIPVYAATGFHISHPFRTQDKQAEYDFNRQFFFQFINSTDYSGHPDWIAKAKTRIKETYTHKNTNHNPESNIPLKNQKMTVPELLAVGKFKNVIKILDESNQNNSLEYAQALFGLTKYDLAISLLHSLIESNQNFNPNLHLLMSRCCAALGEFQTAHAHLKKIESIMPEFPELTYWLHRDPQITFQQARKYFEQEFFDTALRCYEAGLILDSDNDEAQQARKRCLQEIG